MNTPSLDRDAERWRFLRGLDHHSIRMLLGIAAPGPEGLDEVIDQAMAFRAAINHEHDEPQGQRKIISVREIFTRD